MDNTRPFVADVYGDDNELILENAKGSYLKPRKAKGRIFGQFEIPAEGKPVVDRGDTYFIKPKTGTTWEVVVGWYQREKGKRFAIFAELGANE